MKDQFVILANVIVSALALSPHPSHPDAGWEDYTILAHVENTFDHRPIAPAGWEDFTLDEPEVVAPAGWEDFTFPDVSFDFEGAKAAGAQCTLPDEEALNDPNFAYDGLCTAQGLPNSPPAGWQDFSNVAIISEPSTLPEVEQESVSPPQQDIEDTPTEPAPVSSPSQAEGSVLDEDPPEVFDDSILSRDFQEEELLKRVLLTVDSSPFTKHNSSIDENATHDVSSSWSQTPILSFFDISDFQNDDSPFILFCRKVLLPVFRDVSNALSSIELPFQDEMTQTIDDSLKALADVIVNARSGVQILDTTLTVVETVVIALGSKLGPLPSNMYRYAFLFIAVTLLCCVISMRYCLRRRSYKLRRQQQSFLAKQKTQPILRKMIPRGPSSRHWYERADGYHGMCAV